MDLVNGLQLAKSLAKLLIILCVHVRALAHGPNYYYYYYYYYLVYQTLHQEEQRMNKENASEIEDR